MRELRNSEFRIVVAAVLAAIICLTSMGFLASSIERLFNNTSAQLLGGERVISAPEPIDSKVLSELAANNLQFSSTITFYSMLNTKENFVLSSIKAVDQNYAQGKIPSKGTIWLEPNALVMLRVELGDELDLGVAKFKITQLAPLEADRAADGLFSAPRAFINLNDVASTQVLKPGSRASYRVLINGTPAAIKAFDTKIQGSLPAGYKVTKADDPDNNRIRNLDQARKYLTLTLSINILLAAVVIILVAERYNQRQLQQAAILNCMGVTSRKIIKTYIKNFSILALVMTLIGTLIGFALEQVLAKILFKYLNLTLPVPSWQVILLGLACAFLLIAALVWPLITALRNLAPLQILRQQNNRTYRWRAAHIFAGLPMLVRMGLKNIIYNAYSNLTQVLAFATIVCATILLFVVRDDLLKSWQTQLDPYTPNYFAINISKQDLAPFRDLLAANNILGSDFYPVIRGNLLKINDKPASMHRSLNLTWMQNLPADNLVIQGKWPSLSIEQELAERLGVKLGDDLTFSIADQKITAKVGSIRSVRWDTFRPNFYLIYPPGVIDNLPMTNITSFFISEQNLSALLKIVEKFPAVSLISVTALLDQAQLVLKMITLVITYICSFTLFISILLLVSIGIASANMRIYQNNLLRVFGASAWQLKSILSWEYLLLGLSAGLLGGIIALGLGYYVAIYVLKISYSVNYSVLWQGAGLSMFVMLVSGLFSARTVLRTAPVQLLQNMH